MLAIGKGGVAEGDPCELPGLESDAWVVDRRDAEGVSESAFRPAFSLAASASCDNHEIDSTKSALCGYAVLRDQTLIFPCPGAVL
ncbi:MAG TPA: hypothetical protein PK640_20090, partial [Verrucomicrobiota bacterium]|nr:hypothetical protein [Verrucomicrobiota bacterium]